MRPLSAAEMRVAAQRARGYPPGHANQWGSSPEFSAMDATNNNSKTALLLAERPELWESG